MDRRQRLPEVDRSKTSEDVTARFLREFQPQGVLSPAVFGEESRKIQRVTGAEVYWKSTVDRG